MCIVKMVLERPKKNKRTYQIYSGKRRRTIKETVPSIKILKSKSENVQTEEQEILVQDTCLSIEGNSANHTGYNRAKQKRIENWSNLRQQLIEAAVQKECPTSDVCTRCESNTSNLFRCIDCASWLHMCMDCLQASHSLPHLHIFEKWMKDTYLAVDMETRVWKSTHITCNTRHSRQLIIIDDKGRQH